MKRTILTVLIALLAIGIHAQTSNNQQTITVPYDSTANFLGKNAMAYTGQELFLKGLSKSSQAYGYNGFIINYKKDDDLLNDEKNIYKPNENYSSRYEDMAHKYFHVLEVIKHPNTKTDKAAYEDDFYLKLQELSSGDIVYYKYNTNSEYTFPFIVRGYFEKQRQIRTGKEYVLSDDILKISRNLITRAAVPFTTGQTWKCADVNIDNSTNELSLVLESKGVKTTVPYSIFDSVDGIKKIYTADEAKELTRKYNVNNFRRILQNKIRTGMTKDMARLAWGEPQDIKKNGNTETWTYPAGSLTFNGDKIVSSK